MYGYHNRFLYIDLTENTWEVKGFEIEILKKYIGGAGLGAKVLYDGTDAKTDPLGADNLLCFMTGPLTGTRITGSGRHSVVCKSPLTGAWGEASVGGTWGRELKKTGFDGIIIKGRAKKPTYISIDDDKVEFRDASFVWGKDTYETDAFLREATHPKSGVSSIGPAGEKVVLISGIFTDGIEGRAAARCGVGAVQGSKNLKAIVVRGTGSTRVFDESGLGASMKGFLPDFVAKTGGLKNFGTAGLVLGCEQTGDFPIKNWKLGSWEHGAAKISGPIMKETITLRNYHCAGCVVGCGRHVKVAEGPYAPVKGAGPEYETLALFGGSCLVDNLEFIARVNELCNRYGIDTIETGNAIAMAMEAYENGLLTEESTGLKLEWGNCAAVIELIHQMGMYGESLGQTVRIEVVSYPLNPQRAISLSARQLANRKRQLEAMEKEPIQVSIPISGAAVGTLYFSHLIASLREKCDRFHFHIVSKDAPFTRNFLSSMEGKPWVRLYIGKQDREVVDLYDRLLDREVISLEVTKPSEQAFKALTGTQTRGGVILLFSEPVGSQESDNLDFLERHKLIPSTEDNVLLWKVAESSAGIKTTLGKRLYMESRTWRGVRLPKGSKRSADFIGWMLNSGMFSRMVCNNRSVVLKDEGKLIQGSKGVAEFWDLATSI